MAMADKDEISRASFKHLAEMRDMIIQTRATVAISWQIIEQSKKQLMRTDLILSEFRVARSVDRRNNSNDVGTMTVAVRT
jgi:hypothetical protein